MHVVLYKSSKSFPSSVKPTAPLALFDPDRQVSWRTGVYDESFGNMIPRYKVMPFCETWIWPVLLGLEAIQMPLLAHVSFGATQQKVIHNKRSNVSLEITTVPVDFGLDTELIITSGGRIDMVSLIGKDIFPLGIFAHPDVRSISQKVLASNQFWQDFFYKNLIEVRQKLLVRSGKMVAEARRLRRASDMIREI